MGVADGETFVRRLAPFLTPGAQRQQQRIEGLAFLHQVILTSAAVCCRCAARRACPSYDRARNVLASAQSPAILSAPTTIEDAVFPVDSTGKVNVRIVRLAGAKGAMALNGSAASGRFVGAELVIDPIGTVFEPLEHSPAPFRSHLISGECIGDFVMSMLDWNGYRQQVLSGVGALGKLSPDTVKGYVTLGGAGQKTGRLDAKTRELIALAVAISLRCDGCITVHTEAASKTGATKEEIAEALGVAVSVNAGAALVYSTRTLDAFDAASNA